MKKFISPIPNNGAPFYANDFLQLQEEAFKGITSLLYLIPSTESYIVSGLNISNVNTSSKTFTLSAGYVYINGTNGIGDIYSFDGFSGTYPCYITTDTSTFTQRQFKDGFYRNIIETKKVKVVVGTTSNGLNIPFTTFNANPITERRLEYLMKRKSKSIGEITMYAGSLAYFDSTGKGVGENVGFALCNGANGSKNLCGQFVVGYDPTNSDYNTIGDTGGSAAVTLTASQLAPHDHTIQTYKITYPVYGPAIITTATWNDLTSPTVGNLQTTNNAGGGLPHENRPPYYTLAYIQRIS